MRKIKGYNWKKLKRCLFISFMVISFFMIVGVMPSAEPERDKDNDNYHWNSRMQCYNGR